MHFEGPLAAAAATIVHNIMTPNLIKTIHLHSSLQYHDANTHRI